MFTKTSIALAVIVALASSAVAAQQRQLGPRDAFGSSHTIIECTHGIWDAYGLRCDSGS